MINISIGNRVVGDGHPAFIIAEIAQAHDGSLGTAHAYIDALSEIGVDAVKFQTHIAQFESTKDEPFRLKFSRQDESRYDYWLRMEFTKKQWTGLASHAREKGLVFLSSAFSMQAVKMLHEIGMPAWKVGSGEFRSKELLIEMGKTGVPILLSTGMSTYAEIDVMVNVMRERGASFAIFQCTSRYPTSFEDVGLNVIDILRKRFDCPVGLSDHSGTIYPGLAALARGINLLEVHVTFDRRLFGPDISASITMDELKLLTEARNAFRVMDQHPVDKDAMVIRLKEMRTLFSKSVALVRPFSAGSVITDNMLMAKKPGTGIPYAERHKIIGLQLVRDVTPDRILNWEDVDG